MTDFVFTELVHAPIEQRESCALGASAAPADVFTDLDLGKVVKLGPDNNFILAAAGDDIEGSVSSIEPWNVNVGFAFGAVVRSGRLMASCATGSVAVGAEVNAAAQDPVGTRHEEDLPKVQAGNGTLARWRCMRVVKTLPGGDDMILIERVV